MKDIMYPWLEAQWRQIQTRSGNEQLPHALLFAGPAGIGKRFFANQLAQSLLCRLPDRNGYACGECPACQLIQAGTHPDLLRIQPAEDKTLILIDQIRDACAALALKSHAGGHKIAIVQPADQMNSAAANSLLKTLEEPTDNTLLMLITEKPSRLFATIRSRCQQLRFPMPHPDIADPWLRKQCSGQDTALLLRLADGAPLRALQLADEDIREKRRYWLGQILGIQSGTLNPATIAAEWVGDSELRPLYWLGDFVSDLVKLQCNALNSIKNIDLVDDLNRLLRSDNGPVLHQRMDRILQSQRAALGSSVNRQLLLEDLLIEWTPAGQTPRALA